MANQPRLYVTAKKGFYKSLFDKIFTEFDEETGAALKEFNAAIPEEVKKMNEPLQGNFEGIGIQFNMAEDTLMVVQPVSGGPSEKAGILAGDRIVMVEDTLIAGVKMSTEDIMRRLRGPKDSKVNLKILRRGVKELLTFTVKREIGRAHV